MSTETQKVNVLAVLDALSLQTKQRGGCPSVQNIDTARSAITELIKALQPFANANIVQGVVIGLMSEDFERARNALSRAGSES